jgi:HAD superfamily hydrolase (TIGR01509 family)
MKHIIFDCDGVLVDSEPLSMRADVEILAANGVIISEAEAHRRFVGKTFEAMLADIAAERGVELPSTLSQVKNRRLLELYAAHLKVVPGVPELLASLRLPASIASNSPGHRVAEAIRLTGIEQHFGGRIVTFEDVPKGKPEPDVYLETARRAGHSPANCLVVEDSVTGVTSAARAGCLVLGFTGTHEDPEGHGRKLLSAGAAEVFPAMTDLAGWLAAHRA